MLTNPSGRERVVITQAVIEFEGNLEFCETCIGEAARKLGYVTPAIHESAIQIAQQLKADLDASDEAISKQNELIASLTAALAHVKSEPAVA